MISYSQKAEMELLTLLGQSDDEAFTEIYNRYWRKLFVTAANWINNLEEAEEIVQDIFTSLWRKRGTLNLYHLKPHLLFPLIHISGGV